jgi:hypothetical protein
MSTNLAIRFEKFDGKLERTDWVLIRRHVKVQNNKIAENIDERYGTGQVPVLSMSNLKCMMIGIA